MDPSSSPAWPVLLGKVESDFLCWGGLTLSRRKVRSCSRLLVPLIKATLAALIANQECNGSSSVVVNLLSRCRFLFLSKGALDVPMNLLFVWAESVNKTHS